MRCSYMRNPYIRAKMVEALVAFLPEVREAKAQKNDLLLCAVVICVLFHAKGGSGLGAVFAVFPAHPVHPECYTGRRGSGSYSHVFTTGPGSKNQHHLPSGNRKLHRHACSASKNTSTTNIVTGVTPPRRRRNAFHPCTGRRTAVGGGEPRTRLRRCSVGTPWRAITSARSCWSFSSTSVRTRGCQFHGAVLGLLALFLRIVPVPVPVAWRGVAYATYRQ